MTGRSEFKGYLIHAWPEWIESADRGERLLDCLEVLKTSLHAEIPREFWFPCLGQIAFAGESTPEATWGCSHDLLHPGAYLRIHLSGNAKREPIQCVRYLAVVRGQLVGFYPEHRVISINVEQENYQVMETF